MFRLKRASQSDEASAILTEAQRPPTGCARTDRNVEIGRLPADAAREPRGAMPPERGGQQPDQSGLTMIAASLKALPTQLPSRSPTRVDSKYGTERT